MKKLIVPAVAAGVLCMCGAAASAAEGAVDRAHVGEVRAFAVAQGNHDAIVQLHQEGWLEANGQVLPVTEYKDLYRQIGRTWTPDRIGESRFAIPRLRDAMQRSISSDNPYGVLGPGDLVHSGEGGSEHSSPISYWIFVGQDVSRANSAVFR